MTYNHRRPRSPAARDLEQNSDRCDCLDMEAHRFTDGIDEIDDEVRASESDDCAAEIRDFFHEPTAFAWERPISRVFSFGGSPRLSDAALARLHEAVATMETPERSKPLAAPAVVRTSLVRWLTAVAATIFVATSAAILLRHNGSGSPFNSTDERITPTQHLEHSTTVPARTKSRDNYIQSIAGPASASNAGDEAPTRSSAEQRAAP